MGGKKLKSNQIFSIKLNNVPRSCDPLDHDLFVHHLLFRSTQNTLLTPYRIGELRGLIAENWISENSFEKWVFKIRSGMKFSNGMPLDANAVGKSLTRAVYLLAKKKSYNEVASNLIEVEKLKTPSGVFPGIKVEGDQVQLFFNKPVPNLLDHISFGIFGIVSTQDFDPITGEWNDSKRCHSSGPYTISHWSDSSIRLDLRSDYPKDLLHPKAIQKWEATWSPKDKMDFDIVMGTSHDGVENLEFKGGAENNFSYLHLFSFKDPKSPFFDIRVRRKFRDLFWKNFVLSLKPLPTRSFFPTIVQNVNEVIENPETNPADFFPTSDIRVGVKSTFSAFQKKVLDGISKTFLGTNFKIREIPWSESWYESEVENKNQGFKLDIGILASGILVEDPFSDIRFMFLSKEGISLPDANGEILKELSLARPSIQKINQQIWDQAVIIPIDHFRMGLWINPDLDSSWINFLKPPSELQWFGLKN